MNINAYGPVGPTGNVSLFDGGVLLGTWDFATVRTARGTVTLSSPLAIGTHSIKAVYAGDANYQGSSSSSVSVTVAQVATSVRLSTFQPQCPPGRQGDVCRCGYGHGFAESDGRRFLL